MPKFALSDAVQARNEITYNQYKDIQKLYMDVADEAKKKAEQIKDLNLSGKLQAIELDKLEKELQRATATIGIKVNDEIKSSMKSSSQATFEASGKMFDDIGINIREAYRSVPDDIVEMLVTGKIYDGDWSLSSAIWKDIKDTQSDITNIVAKGVAMNKSAYDIAKDLEKYVDPSARKDWEWSKVYPGTKKKIDYSAQRLARTMVSHAYQQSLVRACRDNPFVDGFIWRSANVERTCEICEARDGQFYTKDDLPIDHPNGMCTYLAHTQKSLNEIADDLAAWANGEENLELDKWMDSMEIAKGYTKETKETTEKQWTLSEEQKAYFKAAGISVEDYVENVADYSFMTNDGDFYSWKSSVKNTMKQSRVDAIYQLAHDKGLTLQEYYEKYLKNPFYVETKKIDYTFIKKQFMKEVKKKVPEFTWWQDKFLGKFGYSSDNIPDYNDWLQKVASSGDSKLIQSFANYANKSGMSPEEFYNSKLGKVKYKYVTVQEIIGGKSQGTISNGNPSIPNWQEWIGICKTQTEKEMLGYEKEQHCLFTANEKAALKTYTGGSYERINGYYRSQWWGASTEAQARRHYGDDIASTAISCFGALKKTSFEKDIVMRRGTSLGEIAGFIGGSSYREAKQKVRDIVNNAGNYKDAADELNKLLVGSVCSYSSFVSTSSMWDRGFPGDVEMVFYTPKDTNGLASIMNISRYGTGEGETLLDNDISVKIHHIEESDGHFSSKLRVYAEVLGVREK